MATKCGIIYCIIILTLEICLKGHFNQKKEKGKANMVLEEE